MANFVLSTHMTNGDVLPFLRLASALSKRGHKATLITHGAFAELAEKAGVGFRGYRWLEIHYSSKKLGWHGRLFHRRQLLHELIQRANNAFSTTIYER